MQNENILSDEFDAGCSCLILAHKSYLLRRHIACYNTAIIKIGCVGIFSFECKLITSSKFIVLLLRRTSYDVTAVTLTVKFLITMGS